MPPRAACVKGQNPRDRRFRLPLARRAGAAPFPAAGIRSVGSGPRPWTGMGPRAGVLRMGLGSTRRAGARAAVGSPCSPRRSGPKASGREGETQRKDAVLRQTRSAALPNRGGQDRLRAGLEPPLQKAAEPCGGRGTALPSPFSSPLRNRCSPAVFSDGRAARSSFPPWGSVRGEVGEGVYSMGYLRPLFI